MPTDEEMHRDRKAALDEILNSDSNRRLIVAGPGTGKTFTFQKVLERVEGRGLAMTFLNGLVRDLDSAIGDTTDVYSFHGFSRSLLHHIGGTGVTHGVFYFPPLVEVLVEDIRIAQGATLETAQLGSLFRDLAEDDPFLLQALSSGEYYDSVSHDDAVYRVLRALEEDSSRIPEYPQIVVDEFQDFCPMEVAFVDALATRSPMLIVGDDDQALYRFRDATPEAIRQLATETDYDRFDLPFCTRCTEVIVHATHTVVARAQAAGRLRGRLEKPYECFTPDKRDESSRYPKIVHAHCSTNTNVSPYMAKYIERVINEIPVEEITESHEKGFPTVLVIGPNPFLNQIQKYLSDRFSNILAPTGSQPTLTALDAYRLLIADDYSNLGWRILLQLLQPAGWEACVQTGLEADAPLRDQIDHAFIEWHLRVVEVLSIALEGVEIGPENEQALAEALGVAVSDLPSILCLEASEDPEIDESQPTIMFTSLMGSKGLQAAHVFVVGVNDGHFPRDNRAVTDVEVCQLLVALTRARKSCTIVSTGRLGAATLGQSIFVRWLGPHLTEVYANREFFNAI